MEIVSYIGKEKGKHKYIFLCPQCGAHIVSNLRDGSLAKRCSKCYHSSFQGEGNPNHRHGGRVSCRHLWNAWAGMKQRCTNPKQPKYYRYGGRGIKICNEWMDFQNFKTWAESNGWADGLSLDRIDLDGDYCPENCQFLTVSENSRWKSTTKNLKNKPGYKAA